MAQKTLRVPSNFPTELLVPLPRRKRLGLLQLAQNDPEWKKEFLRRFNVLKKHYSIDSKSDDFWASLAFHLLIDFIPGFREAEPTRRGRPRTNCKNRQVISERILADVDAIKEKNERVSDIEACRLLHRRKGYAGQSIETLRKRLRQARAGRKADEQLAATLKAIGLSETTDKSQIGSGTSPHSKNVFAEFFLDNLNRS